MVVIMGRESDISGLSMGQPKHGRPGGGVRGGGVAFQETDPPPGVQRIADLFGNDRAYMTLRV